MALVVLALLLFMPLAGTTTLEVAPAAVPWDSSTLLTVDSAEPLNATSYCVFDRGNAADACTVDDSVPTRCTCRAPTSLALLGDAPLELRDPGADGTLVASAVVTYYDPATAPELLSYTPVGADCWSGLVDWSSFPDNSTAPADNRTQLVLRARNAAPTDSLLCSFGELGSTAATLERRARACGEMHK